MGSSTTSSESDSDDVSTPFVSNDSDLLFPREHEYFAFDDGNVTFLIEQTLFTVHRYFFLRDSPVISSMFALLQQSGETRGTKTDPIVLQGTKKQDFERFLKLLYPPKIGEDSLASFDEWASVLHVADVYDFSDAKELAILKLAELAPCVPRLALGRRYHVRLLIHTALRDICNREAPLSTEEVRLMDTEDTALIMQCRESLLTCTEKGHTYRAFIDDPSVAVFFASRLPLGLDETEDPPETPEELVYPFDYKQEM